METYTIKQYTIKHSIKKARGAVLNAVIAVVAFTVLLAPQVNAATELYFIHNDHLGTPQVITDKNQAVVWEGKQKPFGEVEVTTNTLDSDTRFPGQYLDEESGLHYNYFRDYDPTIGRYIQSDPIGLGGGINTYGYVEGNPTNFIDPTGEYSQALGWGAGRAVVAPAINRALSTALGRSTTLGGAIYDLTYSDPAEDARDEAGGGDGESCPSNDKDNWEKIPGSNQAYKPKNKKEPIFEKDRAGDRSHGGSEWKKWDKKNDWVKGKPRNGTYDANGRRLRD